MAKLQPFGDRVLVKIPKQTEQVVGGIVLAAPSDDKANRGIVVEVGEGTTLSDGTVKPLPVKIGDEVVFTVGSGISYNTESEKLRILSMRDIVGKVIGE